MANPPRSAGDGKSKPRQPRKPRVRAPSTTPAASSAPAARQPSAPAPVWPLRLSVAVAAGVLALDQASKWLVVHYLDLATRREMDVIDPFLNLRMAWNEGVNFGLFSSGADMMRLALIAVAVAICLWVGIWVQRTRPGRFARIAAGLLLGGAIGNVIDRVAYGAVADFLNMSLPGWTNPYSFNVADIAIFAGAIGLVLQPSRAAEGPGGQAA